METLLTEEARKRLIQVLLDRKRAEYPELAKAVKEYTSRPDHHLSVLVKAKLLRREGRGTYTINPMALSGLRQQFNIVVPVALIGGLGKELTLYADILDALAKQSILPRKYVLITSPEIGEEFENTYPKEQRTIETDVIKLDYTTVLRENLPLIREKFEKLFEALIVENELICELTGGTKPVTITLLELAHRNNLRKFYFSGRRILWL